MIFSDEPLSDDELDELDAFLCHRELEEVEGDEGIIDISELDGFFTAIVSGPEMVVPSRWLPLVWGDMEPEWESGEDLERILSLMIRHMNGIAAALLDQQFEFEPIFLEHEIDGEAVINVDEWCLGYIKGVALQPERWDAAGDDIQAQLAPIALFSGERGWKVLDTLPEEKVEELKKSIPQSVRFIHSYWLRRRSEEVDAEVAARTRPQVGRNEPCPCGSGKKAKKCCMH